MAAKKKMSAQEQWDQAVKSGAIRPLKQPVQESISGRGSSSPAKGVKTTSLPAPKTPVRSGTGDLSVAGFQTPGIRTQVSPKQVVKAAASVVGLGAASAAKIVTKQVVSEGTKKLQRELASEMRDRAGKGMSKNERVGRAEDRAEWSPDEYAEWQSTPAQLRKDISQSMKNTTKTKKSIQIKRK